MKVVWMILVWIDFEEVVGGVGMLLLVDKLVFCLVEVLFFGCFLDCLLVVLCWL